MRANKNIMVLVGRLTFYTTILRLATVYECLGASGADFSLWVFCHAVSDENPQAEACATKTSAPQKCFDFLRQLFRQLLGQKMAGGHRMALRFDGAVPPGLQHVVQAMEWAFFRP